MHKLMAFTCTIIEVITVVSSRIKYVSAYASSLISSSVVCNTSRTQNNHDS